MLSTKAMAMIMVGANDSPASKTPRDSVSRSPTHSSGKVVKAVTLAATASNRASGNGVVPVLAPVGSCALGGGRPASVR